MFSLATIPYLHNLKKEYDSAAFSKATPLSTAIFVPTLYSRKKDAIQDRAKVADFIVMFIASLFACSFAFLAFDHILPLTNSVLYISSGVVGLQVMGAIGFIIYTFIQKYKNSKKDEI